MTSLCHHFHHQFSGQGSPSAVPTVSTGSASAAVSAVSASETAPSDAASSDGKIGEETVMTEEAGRHRLVADVFQFLEIVEISMTR